MRGDLTSRHVRGFGSHLQFLERVLRCPGLITLGEHSPGGEYFDHVDAVLHLCTDDMSDLVGPIGDLKITLFRKHHHVSLRREVVQVAVTTGDGDPRTAGYDAWTDNESLSDGVPQIHRQKRQRADIAHAGEPSFQSLAGIHHAGESALEWRVLEIVDLVVTVGARAQVGVAIDEAGEKGRRTEVDDLSARGDS